MTDKIKQRIVYVLTRKNKTDDDDSDLYVGCMSQPLERRLQGHRKDAQRSGRENNRLYKRMREVGLENWEILPLLGRTCGKKEVFELERKWIKILKAGLNTYLPARKEETVQEYNANRYKDNKEAILQWQAKYYEANREAVRRRQAKYYEVNQDVIREYQTEYRKK